MAPANVKQSQYHEFDGEDNNSHESVLVHVVPENKSNKIRTQINDASVQDLNEHELISDFQADGTTLMIWILSLQESTTTTSSMVSPA